MNARGHALWIVDIALCVSAVGALTGQLFGRDSVYAEPGQSSAPAASQAIRFGRDSVNVTRGVVQSRSTKIAALNPGRR